MSGKIVHILFALELRDLVIYERGLFLPFTYRFYAKPDDDDLCVGSNRAAAQFAIKQWCI